MASPVPLQDKSAFARAHNALVNHSDYQFNLPEFHKPAPPEWLAALGRLLEKHWYLVKWGIWIGLAVLLMWAAYALIRKYGPVLSELIKRRGKAPSPVEEWRPTLEGARELLRESDELAAAGRYGEAIHLLLLRSIEEIEKQRPNLVRPNLTSREIGSLRPMPQTARSTFGEIAKVVERAVFAGEAVGAHEFAWCRAAYERFALPEIWGTPA